MADKDLGCLNDGTTTRRNPATGGHSTPDITVVHNSWIGRAEWCCLDEMASDHLPILVEMQLQVECLSARSDRLRWNWAEADWAAYRSAVDRKVAQSPLAGDNQASLSERLSFLTETIRSEATTHVGMVRVSSTSSPWLTAGVRAEIRKRNSLGRQLPAKRDEWLQACHRVKEVTAEAKREHWHRFVGTLADHSDSPRAWAVVRSLSGRGPAPSSRNRILVHEGKMYNTDRRKADLFVRQYARVSSHRFSTEDRRINRAVKCRLTRAGRKTGPEGKECSEYTAAELGEALRKTRANGAEGPDGIVPRLLNELGHEKVTH